MKIPAVGVVVGLVVAAVAVVGFVHSRFILLLALYTPRFCQRNFCFVLLMCFIIVYFIVHVAFVRIRGPKLMMIMLKYKYVTRFLICYFM